MLGPHKKVQQFLVAGIFSNWQVPVLFDFDANVTLSTLFSLICGVEAAGARVVATVSDMEEATRASGRSSASLTTARPGFQTHQTRRGKL